MKYYILGIDQGIANLGYAVICFEKKKNGEITKELIKHKYVKTTSKFYIGTRLEALYKELLLVIKEYKICAIGCEKLFFSQKSENKATNKFRNKSASMVYTNLITGVIFLMSSQKGIPVIDFTPGTIKKEICGNGKATKEEMIEAINSLFGIDYKISEHEADAIGIAYKTGIAFIEDIETYTILKKQIKEKGKIK